MKGTSFLPILMLLLFSIFATTVNATELGAVSLNLNGESNTKLGNFQIKELPPVTLNGVTMRTFELVYKNAGNSVMIYLDERSSCGEYIVRSKNLEVKYVCNKSTFGAKLVTGKLRQYDPLVNANFLSRDEFLKQAMISPGGLEISSALGLIASYYPALFNRPDLLD
jgi:hypothetical protein